MPDVILQTDHITIPESVKDLSTFSLWTESPDFPTEGRISYIQGRIWVDLSVEQPYSHNVVKLWISMTLARLGRDLELGTLFADRMRLTNAAADLSNEPDGMFVTHDALKTGRLRPVAATTVPGIREFEGTPDMVLEVLSESSEEKDRVELAEAYFRAGVPEYWLADARGNRPVLQIFRRGRTAFVGNKPTAGWVRSQVFGRQFRLVQSADPLGNPHYTLEHRA